MHLVELREGELVHRAVDTRREQARVVGRREVDRADLAAVPAEVAEQLARVRVVYVDDRRVHRGEELPAVAEAALAARADREGAELADVVPVDVHEPQLVREAEQQVQAGRVDRHGEHLGAEVLRDFGRVGHVVPEDHVAVLAARDKERLADAHVETGDRSGVERLAHDVADAVLGLRVVGLRQVKHVQLAVRGHDRDALVARRRRDAEAKNLHRVVGGHEAVGVLALSADVVRLDAAEQLLVLGLLVDADGPHIATADEPLGAVRDQRVDRDAVGRRQRQLVAVLKVLDEQQVAVVGRHDDAVVRRQPHVGQVVHRLRLAETGGEQLQLVVLILEELEDAVAGDAHHRRVLRADGALVDQAAVLRRVGPVVRRDHRDGLRLLDAPQHEVPLREAALRGEVPAVGGEAEAHVLARADLGHLQEALAAARLRVVHGDRGRLRHLGDGEAAAVVADRHRGERLARVGRGDELLGRVLHVVHDDVLARGPRDGVLVDELAAVFHVVLHAHDEAARDHLRLVGGGVAGRHGSRDRDDWCSVCF
mmetsp:Transcript_38183/g.117963  ORF Transcript_38183/g.117963 Transcript_38183/m.117963 type:complete len:539 (-) Transcript_38183:121-1737(-)